MKAIGFYEFGGPEVLQVVELPDPIPGPGEVRVRVGAAAVSPTDTLRRAGIRALDGKPAPELAEQGFPLVPGMELAGVIDLIGPNTETDLQVGEHVVGAIFPSGTRGAYSELVVLPVESVVRTPEGVDDIAASTLAMNGLTAMVSLETLQLDRGQTIGVTGAAGTYGGYVVQLAKAAGLQVIADAAEKDRDLVRSLGADVVVERGDDVADRFLEIAPDGLDGLADGAVLNEKVARAVKSGGNLVTVRHFESAPVNGVTFHAVRVRHNVRDTDKLDRLRRLVEEGKLSLRVARTFPACEAAEAHRLLELGGTRGRVVLNFGD
ncbi:NADP-dependent oxidoreductase [Rhodococcus sp. NPDC057529]|uniref:NADP-dependent oxidoreductase n=1 Tax=Rhodococcus sp. NPDC057529 TaxID=3346158 RepID=UPI00366B0F30